MVSPRPQTYGKFQTLQGETNAPGELPPVGVLRRLVGWSTSQWTSTTRAPISTFSSRERPTHSSAMYMRHSLNRPWAPTVTAGSVLPLTIVVIGRFRGQLNEDPYKVSVTRKIYPGDAAPGPTGSLPLRTGWPADGKFVKGSGWHTGAASPPQGPPHVKKPTYAWQHNQFVRPSA